jgi:hypothetical protein
MQSFGMWITPGQPNADPYERSLHLQYLPSESRQRKVMLQLHLDEM